MKHTHLLALGLLLAACTADTRNDQRVPTDPDTTRQATPADVALVTYDPAKTFTTAQKDTLLVNMITFIHKRPEAAINRDRTDPAFRKYYVDQLGRYKLVYHQQAPDSTHWFYLIRPARSASGDERGVGGRFRTDAAMGLVEFEEIFNTPVLPEAELKAKGLMLFQEMMDKGNVDAYQGERSLVEWPDGRLKYDRQRREWRYDD